MNIVTLSGNFKIVQYAKKKVSVQLPVKMKGLLRALLLDSVLIRKMNVMIAIILTKQLRVQIVQKDMINITLLV